MQKEDYKKIYDFLLSKNKEEIIEKLKEVDVDVVKKTIGSFSGNNNEGTFPFFKTNDEEFLKRQIVQKFLEKLNFEQRDKLKKLMEVVQNG